MSEDEDGYNKTSDNYRYGKARELVDTTVSSILVMQSRNCFRNQGTREALTDPKWAVFLPTNGKFGDMHKAEVHVSSDAVPCVGPGAMSTPKETGKIFVDLLLPRESTSRNPADHQSSRSHSTEINSKRQPQPTSPELASDNLLWKIR